MPSTESNKTIFFPTILLLFSLQFTSNFLVNSYVISIVGFYSSSIMNFSLTIIFGLDSKARITSTLLYWLITQILFRVSSPAIWKRGRWCYYLFMFIFYIFWEINGCIKFILMFFGFCLLIEQVCKNYSWSTVEFFVLVGVAALLSFLVYFTAYIMWFAKHGVCSSSILMVSSSAP